MAEEGLLAGVHPMLSSGGTGSVLFEVYCPGETVAVFKPADEEPLAENNPRGNSCTNDLNNASVPRRLFKAPQVKACEKVPMWVKARRER